MPFHRLIHHSFILLLPLFFASFLVFAAAAQPPLPSLPPPQQSSSPKNSTPTATLLVALLATALFFLVFFTIYIVRCVGVPVNPIGRSRHFVTAPKGLGVDLLRSFPTFVYSEVKEHKIGKETLECTICISEFKDYEMLRLIPKCDHVFHLACINEWLSEHVTCPVCRADLVPPSGDSSVKGGADDSVRESRDHVEVEIDEPNLPTDESMQGRGKEGGVAGALNRDRIRESRWGKKWRRLGRSHSTGHLLVCPGDDTEKFTLRLPGEVRKQIMERPMTPNFTREDGSRRGYRTGEGSSKGRCLRRLDCLDLQIKSDRCAFRRIPLFLIRVSPISPELPMFADDGPSPYGSSSTPKSASNGDQVSKFSEPPAGTRPAV